MRTALTGMLVLAAPAGADPLQDQVLAGMKTTNTADVAFTETIRATQTGSAPKEYVNRYDPRAAPGARWTLVSVDGRAPTPKQAADAAKRGAKRRPLTYGDLAKWFAGPATVVGRTPTTVTYRFARLPAGEIKMGSHDASADTVADAVVVTAGKTPFVERVRLASSKPFRMMLVAKVNQYVFTSTFRPLPDGRLFPVATQMQMSGSMMGKSGGIEATTRYEPRR